jgi:hypothetical protein
MWVKNSENNSSSQRTTNVCEGFHSKLYPPFYCGHPNIFQFIDVLRNFQIDAYIQRVTEISTLILTLKGTTFLSTILPKNDV